jgi:oxygen-independent coproporphyrinogen-3 oxidase
LLGVDFQEYYRNELASLNDLEEEGFLERTADGLSVTSTGRLFIRNIAMRFDAYLGRGTVGVYSKTI